MTIKKKEKISLKFPELIVKKTKTFLGKSKIVCKKVKFFKVKPTVLVVILLLIIFGFLGFLLRDKFLAAIVNGKPIFRYELNQRLTSSFGKEMLENIIVERLIQDEAKAKNIVINEEEIDEEIKKIQQNLGEGSSLEDVLKLQGMTMQQLRDQLKIRLQVNKILEKEVTVSDEEVEQFIKDNGKSLTATSEAEKKEEARSIVKSQKIETRIQSWVSELLNKAKITRFLN